jgi:hypothetical protein
MENRYHLLVKATFTHSYFGSMRFDGIQTDMSAGARQALLDNGLLFRPLPDGFNILFDTRFAGRDRDRSQVCVNGLSLVFLLRLTDPDFYTYTAIDPGDITRSFFYFSNSAAPDGPQPAPGLLHGGDFASANDRVVFGKLPGIGTSPYFGWLQLVLDANLENAYEIRFPVRSVYWNYILVSRYLQELSSPAIIDPTTREAFEGPETITLQDSRTALSFVSGEQIPWSQSENKTFQLVSDFEAGIDKYKVILAALPRPAVQILSNGRKPDGKPAKRECSEIFIY